MITQEVTLCDVVMNEKDDNSEKQSETLPNIKELVHKQQVQMSAFKEVAAFGIEGSNVTLSDT